MLVYAVDDNLADRIILEEASKNHSETVLLSFESAGQLLRHLDTTESLPDAILSDLNMPVMDGFELWDKLNKCAKVKSIPFFLYSTAPSAAVLSAVKLLGITRIFEKPFAIEGYNAIFSDIKNVIQEN